MTIRVAAPAMALVLLGAAACIGSVRTDVRAEAVARAPEDVVQLPLRSSRPHWLLLQEPGWVSSHETRYGGDEVDKGGVVVRVARFETAAAAVAASEQLTPEYLYRTARSFIVAPPAPVMDVELGDGVVIHERIGRIRRTGPEGFEAASASFISLQTGSVVVLIQCDEEARPAAGAVVERVIESINFIFAAD